MTDKKFDDGGPAYPQTRNEIEGPIGYQVNVIIEYSGKTWLDDAAMQIFSHWYFDTDPRQFDITAVARSSYKCAQALLAEKRRLENGR